MKTPIVPENKRERSLVASAKSGVRSALKGSGRINRVAGVSAALTVSAADAKYGDMIPTIPTPIGAIKPQGVLGGVIAIGFMFSKDPGPLMHAAGYSGLCLAVRSM